MLPGHGPANHDSFHPDNVRQLTRSKDPKTFWNIAAALRATAAQAGVPTDAGEWEGQSKYRPNENMSPGMDAAVVVAGGGGERPCVAHGRQTRLSGTE